MFITLVAPHRAINMDIIAFTRKLTKLKVDRTKGAPAPHKAVLLLSLIQSIECGDIQENKVYIVPELVARFKDNWHLLVKNEKFNPNFSLPFFHLKNDGFWFLRTEPGKEILLTSPLARVWGSDWCIANSCLTNLHWRGFVVQPYA